MKRWRIARNVWNLKHAPWYDGVGIEEDNETVVVPSLVCWFYRGDDAEAQANRMVELWNASLPNG